ncbi:hypothetical protein ACJ6WF_47545 [Streptomyces sp. MMS24-I2-30]|uniref:hypothetical protein n=1 Tax=Streptomyces sp. MMS24-I2-30 TaxID=3351564 RepID=UPI003896B60A
MSVAHHEAETNKRVMALPRTWDGKSDDALADIASRAGESFTPRLSCVMTDDGISSVTDMVTYLEWGYALGYRRFIFRTCSEIPDGFKKPTDYSVYNDRNARSIEPLSSEFQRLRDAELIFRQRKSDSKVDVFRWRDAVIDLDESSEELDPDGKIRRLNVMPDGVVYTSWISPTSNLFADDRPIVKRSAAKENLRVLS